MSGPSASASPTPAHVEVLVRALLHVYRPLLIDVAHALQRATFIADADSSAAVTLDQVVAQAARGRILATTPPTAASPTWSDSPPTVEATGIFAESDDARSSDAQTRKRSRSETGTGALASQAWLSTTDSSSAVAAVASSATSRETPPPLRKRGLQLRLNGPLPMPAPAVAAAPLTAPRAPPPDPLCLTIANDALHAGVAVLAEAVLASGACAAWLADMSRECAGDAELDERDAMPSSSSAAAWALADVLLRLDAHVAARAAPTYPSQPVLRWRDYGTEGHDEPLDDSASRACDEVPGRTDAAAAAAAAAGRATTWGGLSAALQDAVFAAVAASVVRATAVHAARLLHPLGDPTAAPVPWQASGAAVAHATDGAAGPPPPPPSLTDHVGRSTPSTPAPSTFEEVQGAVKERQRRARARARTAPPASAPPHRAVASAFPCAPPSEAASSTAAVAAAAGKGREAQKRANTPRQKNAGTVEPAWAVLARGAEAQDQSCILVRVHPAVAGDQAAVQVQALSSPFFADFTATTPPTVPCTHVSAASSRAHGHACTDGSLADVRAVLDDPRHELVWRWCVGLQQLAAATATDTGVGCSERAVHHTGAPHRTGGSGWQGAGRSSTVEVPPLQTYATAAAQLFTRLHGGAASCPWGLVRAYAAETGKLVRPAAPATTEGATDAVAHSPAPLDVWEGDGATAAPELPLTTSTRRFSLRPLPPSATTADAMVGTAGEAQDELRTPPTHPTAGASARPSPVQRVVWLPLSPAPSHDRADDGVVPDNVSFATSGEADGMCCATATVFHNVLESGSTAQRSAWTADTAEALDEVGAVLAAMCDACEARTLLDGSAWRYGRNRMQAAAASLVHVSSEGHATDGGSAPCTGDAPLNASGATSAAPRLVGVFHHETGVLHVTDGTTFALEVE